MKVKTSFRIFLIICFLIFPYHPGYGTSPETENVHEVYRSFIEALRNREGKVASELVSQATIDAYERCRKGAINSDSTLDFTLIEILLTLRLSSLLNEQELKSMTGKDIFSWEVQEGIIIFEGISIDTVHIEGNVARATVRNYGQPIHDGYFRFIQEHNVWKFDIKATAEMEFAKFLQQTEKSEIETVRREHEFEDVTESYTYGSVNSDEDKWNFFDIFFADEVTLPNPADSVILYKQGLEYITFHNEETFGRQLFHQDVINTVLDEEHHLLLIGKVDKDVEIWNPFTQQRVDYYAHILDDHDIISIGYHPQSRYCGILYKNFDVAVFNHEGEQLFSYQSQTDSLRGDLTGTDQNMHFRDDHTLYFFDRDVLVAIDLTTQTSTQLYKVRDLEKHSGYWYYFNSSNDTVTIFSEYCAGCDIGGEILVMNLDSLEVLNKFYSEEYGQSFTFCKYYEDKFITASKGFEVFTINYISETN
jgi:hypothetical protein